VGGRRLVSNCGAGKRKCPARRRELTKSEVNSRCRRHAAPEFIELSGVKKSSRFDDLTGLHLEVPRVRVVIRDAIFGSRRRVEKIMTMSPSA
jgi:hypothetical protein